MRNTYEVLAVIDDTTRQESLVQALEDGQVGQDAMALAHEILTRLAEDLGNVGLLL